MTTIANFQVADTIQAVKTNNGSDSELNVSRNTIELASIRTLSDTALIVQPKPKASIKTIPIIPVNDSIEHASFNVIDGNYVFPKAPGFFESFYFTPFDPTLKEQQFERKKIKKDKPQLNEKKVVVLIPEKKDSTPKPLTNTLVGFATTDWMLGIIIFALIIFGWLRVGYSRYFQTAIQASINYFAARRVFEEANATRTRVFYFMNFLFFITLSLFVTQYFEFNRSYLFGLHGMLQFILFFIIIIAAYTIKSLILYLFDFIFLSRNGFSSYVFTVFLYNKIVGFLLLPIVAIIPFVPQHVTHWLFLAGVIIIVLLYIFRVFKGLQLCFKNRLSIFYLILYLCALEILPMMILIKLALG